DFGRSVLVGVEEV
ncbi:hypothetical protein VN97_g6917, partial [Penicillium thymicola]